MPPPRALLLLRRCCRVLRPPRASPCSRRLRAPLLLPRRVASGGAAAAAAAFSAATAAPPAKGGGGAAGKAAVSSDAVTESDTEIQDASFIFERVWSNLVAKYGEHNLVFPKDILWMSGAPGSGKGVLTDFVKKLRGITSDVIVTSDLLKGSNIQAIKDQGQLVSNRVVVQRLFETLLKPCYSKGAIVDGFPRTMVQGECLKMLYDSIMQLRRKFADTEYRERIQRPVFHIMVLFVEQDVSVERQLKRGRTIDAHNRRIQSTGIGELMAKRSTDSDPVLASERYQQFKNHVYDSLQTVKKKFPFHLIDASGTIEQAKKRIQRELQYQSDLELSNTAFEMVRRIPLPDEITQDARHFLVRRIDEYARKQADLFDRVLQVLESDFVGIMKRQALLGKCIIRSDNEVFQQPTALDMALDVLAERGYTTVLDYQKILIPDRIECGQIFCRKQKVYEFHISFPRPLVRFSP